MNRYYARAWLGISEIFLPISSLLTLVFGSLSAAVAVA